MHQFTVVNRRFGSNPENLRSSKCLPVCPPKQTSTSQSSLTFREQRSQHGAPLVGQLELRRGFALDQAKRIDAVFDVEREINGQSADERLAVRRARAAPLVADLEAWMRAERARLSRHSEVQPDGVAIRGDSYFGAALQQIMEISQQRAIAGWRLPKFAHGAVLV